MRDLTVVVSAPGQCATLGRCLASVAAQTLTPDRFEVVVVLHGPGETAREALKRAAEGPLAAHDVVLADSVAPTSAAARNVGVDLARADWVTFVDGRDVASADLLERLYASRSPEHLAAARVLPGYEPAQEETLVGPERAVPLLRSRGGMLLPTSWLRAVPFVDGLDAHSDSVLAGHLLSAFDHRFAAVDVAPALAGATYRVDVDASAAPARPAVPLGSAVRQRVTAIAELTAGTQADPVDRSPVTHALVAAEVADLRAEVGGDPEALAMAERLLREAGVRGVRGLRSRARARGPHDDAVWSLFRAAPDDVHSVVVVAGSAGSVNSRARMLSFLARNGIGVRIVHYSGRLKPALRRLPDTHRVEVLPAAAPAWVESRLADRTSRQRRIALRATQEALRVGRRVVPELVPPRVTAPAYRRLDATAAALLDEPGATFVLDRGGATLLRAYASRVAAPETGGAHELAVLTLRTAAGRLGGSNTDAHAARAASRILRSEPARTREVLGTQVWAMVAHRLQRAGRLEASAQLLDDVRAVFGADAARHNGLPALVTLQSVLTGNGVPGDAEVDRVVEAARAVLDEADAVLGEAGGVPAEGDDTDGTASAEALAGLDEAGVDRIAFLAGVALELLFARRLHTAQPRTPIVDAPTRFLAPLRETRVGRLLGQSNPRPSARAVVGTARPSSGSPGRPRVTLLPGAYPKFAAAVVDELSDAADVEVLDLSSVHTRFTNTAVDPWTVRERLLGATGHLPAVDPATAEALSADVVFVDWADKGLAWVTQVVPEGTRVVVRLHGVDTLSAWLHTAQWDKVTDAIFPAEHMRASAAAALGGRLDHVRQHVVPLPLHVEKWRLPKRPAAAKTLGMVGWAQQVKDPLWALDVLAELRRHDPQWRLRLIGADFDLGSRNRIERAAGRAFHARMTDELLWDGVDYVGYTTRLPDHLRDVGWALSSSRREGFHTGLVEMAVGGAVPVVRDWPVYAGIGGAKDLYPADWVVTTPLEAAERILSISGSGRWEAEGRAAADASQERFSGSGSGDLLRRIVLGEG